jgi:hypothetical protein
MKNLLSLFDFCLQLNSVINNLFSLFDFFIVIFFLDCNFILPIRMHL